MEASCSRSHILKEWDLDLIPCLPDSKTESYALKSILVGQNWPSGCLTLSLFPSTSSLERLACLLLCGHSSRFSLYLSGYDSFLTICPISNSAEIAKWSPISISALAHSLKISSIFYMGIWLHSNQCSMSGNGVCHFHYDPQISLIVFTYFFFWMSWDPLLKMSGTLLACVFEYKNSILDLNLPWTVIWTVIFYLSEIEYRAYFFYSVEI